MPDDQEVGQPRLRRLRAKPTPPADDATVESPSAAPAATPDARATSRAAVPAATAEPPGRRPWMRIALIVAVAVVVGVIAGGLSAYAIHRSTPTYQSVALMEIDQPQAIASSSDEGVVAKLGRLRFKYAGLVRTQVFAAPVAEQLGLSPGAVSSALFTAADQQSLLLAVGARSHDAAQARLIAQAASQYLTTYARDEQNRNSIPEAQQITFDIATPALSAHKIEPTRRRELLVGIFVFVFTTGLVSGLALVGRRRDS